MATSSNNRQKRLYRAGLIVGLAGAVWLALFALATAESPFTVLVLSLPFLAMVVVAWKWPVIGGILLIAAGLFWAVWRPIAMPPTPLRLLLPILPIAILPVSLPLLATGILFLLSRRGEYRG